MNATILFADNERGIRQYCRQELEAEGFDVVLAEDGEEAVSLLSTKPVDLAILDEYMPRCGGRESARRIKRSYAQLPVILFTADSFFESYKSPQIDATVIKSADLSDLKETIARLLPNVRPNAKGNRAPECPASVKPVAVNPAFFQEIKDDHEQLTLLLTSLKAWLERGPSVYHQRERFIDLVLNLRDELALHFSLEERFGYFEDALEVAPRLSLRAGELRDEHRTLSEEIERLTQLAEASRSRLDGFGNVLARARGFFGKLREHERRERELILQAYNDDFGVGD